MKVWIVSPNYEYEGLGEAFAAFNTLAKAEKYVGKLISWQSRKPNLPYTLQESLYEDCPEEWDEFFEREDKWRQEQPDGVPCYADSWVITEMDVK